MMLLALLLPLFLLAALGALLARATLLAPGWQPGLNALTARLFIPALLFGGAYRTGLPASLSWPFMAAFFVPLVVLFFVTAFSGQRDAARGLAATYSNTVFVGIPVLTLAFGADSLEYAFPIIAFHALVAFSLYFITDVGGGRLLPAIVNTVGNPIVGSLMLGLALNLTGVHLAQPLTQLLALLAGAALPCALLALGASLAGFQVRSWPETAAVVAVKLLLLPACVWGLAQLLRLPAPAAAVLVVIASCPAAVNGAVLVQADGKSPALASSAILLSSLACMVTIPLWIWCVRPL
jgi:malonate transporter